MDSSIETTTSGGRFRSDPHPSLRRFVVEYWGLARDLGSMGGFTITPDRFGELICCADDLFVIRDGRREKLPRCFLVGLLDGPLRIEADGIVRCIAARLQPWAIGQISTNAPEPDSSRGWEDAEGFFRPRLAPILEMVERCEWQVLAELLDELLRDEADRWKPDLGCFGLAEQFVGIEPRPTEVVAQERRITGRQVERRVRSLTRMSPKQLACLSRFQRVRDAIWLDPSIDLAGVAIDAGYSDQPHMTRHFRRYSGQTPAQFARDSAAKKQWLAALDVAFVQERAADKG